MSADAAAIRARARFLREQTVRLIGIAKTGHYASSFSCAEILAVLYDDVLRLRRGEPEWPGRDRFLLGKGHAAVALYPLLAGLDYFPSADLDGYASLGSPFGDHPDMRRIPGIDFSSGSLGHALSAGLGMALAAPLTGHDYNVYALLGDGELHEGQVWEAALGAAHFGDASAVDGVAGEHDTWSARAAAVRRRDRRREAETRGMPTVPLRRCADRYSANE